MRGIKTNTTPQEQQAHGKYAHAGNRTRVTSMGGLYDAITLRARAAKHLATSHAERAPFSARGGLQVTST